MIACTDKRSMKDITRCHDVEPNRWNSVWALYTYLARRGSMVSVIYNNTIVKKY